MNHEEKLTPAKVTAAIQKVLKPEKKPVPLHEPCFTGREWDDVKDCLDSSYVSSVGRYVDQFEEALARFTGVNYAVAVINGTAALQVCLKLAGVQPEDEVLVPALTFVATANAVCYCGAIPHLVDSEMDSLGVNPEKLANYLEEIVEFQNGSCYNRRTHRPIKALVAMHTFGHPVRLDSILQVCERYGLVLIEDAAESLGSYYQDVHTGNFGKLSALSFNGNKIVTTGGGGAVLTNDEALYRKAKHLTTTAKLPHRWAFVHDEVAYNYRMPNLNAALGCAQLEQIEHFLCCKRALAEEYRTAFAEIPGVEFFTEQSWARSNYWLNTLILSEENAPLRDLILEETNNQGIQTRPAWVLMHQLPMFRNCPRMDLSTAESLARRVINIPSGARLGEAFCKPGNGTP
ncbi:LegC family aminotransferase [Faecalispora anaeroviscerum]|uniref:LegC family aminotransferase n=1 Tax=Faecalispora anaeroviscerum TaxID=2991836 RepID=UPI0024BBC735|nr:LegC family aminotransferase [Faecalispora anaeroviscerum]